MWITLYLINVNYFILFQINYIINAHYIVYPKINYMIGKLHYIILNELYT